jgi:cyclopropane-fatty-acyl-phospholipid synthase
MSKKSRTWAEKLLTAADIAINGSRPWDITVHNDALFKRVLRKGSLGLGESYMDGWWDVPSLDQFFYKVCVSKIDKRLSLTWPVIKTFLSAYLLNLQVGKRAFEIGEKHYDAGNDLYEKMLDARRVYTCGYWKNSATLNEAQEAKLDLVCKKIGLKAGDRVLDIGCGWGSFAKFAAEKYGAHVVGITVSKEQLALATKLCAGLPIELRYQDYREVTEKFDHIVSLGMFEHVGIKNYRDYMRVAERCLNDGGLFLLHTIGSNRSVHHPDAWINEYIFPNSVLPSVAQIAKAVEGLFIIEDLHNFGADYDKTLMAWFENFNRDWPELKNKYSERFYRMWKYYLLSFAGCFRARRMQLWQIVLSKKGIQHGYTSVR